MSFLTRIFDRVVHPSVRRYVDAAVTKAADELAERQERLRRNPYADFSDDDQIMTRQGNLVRWADVPKTAEGLPTDEFLNAHCNCAEHNPDFGKPAEATDPRTGQYL